jgi:hypothetical protein
MEIVSINEFYLHTLNHINNVGLLGKLVLDQVLLTGRYKEIYENKDIAVKMLELHDAAKIRTDEKFLKEHNLEEPIIGRLYEFYGKNGIDRSFIDKMNDIDNAVVVKFLEESGVKNIDVFLDFERLIDCVERGMNSLTSEEMGKIAVPASSFLDLKCCDERRIVNYLENYYNRYTFEYTDLKGYFELDQILKENHLIHNIK